MALHILSEAADYEVIGLLTTVSEDFRRIESSPGVRESLLDEQARATGLPVEKIYVPSADSGGCSNQTYNEVMADALAGCRARGVRTIAYGDLFLRDLREWREANLAEVGMRALFPIWGKNTTELAHTVIALGFKLYLSCVTEMLGADYVGRLYDETLVKALPLAADPCGENGEFHTFVCDGPISNGRFR